MEKETSVKWLFDMLWEEPKDKFTWYSILIKAKEMHKQEIIDAFKNGLKSPYHQDYTFVTQDNQEGTKSAQYYQETFGGGGSHNSSNISDIELPQQEISDEEIEKAINEYASAYQCPSEVSMCKHDVISAWNNAIKWYREQLKSKI
jgi:hypothetical protein